MWNEFSYQCSLLRFQRARAFEDDLVYATSSVEEARRHQLRCVQTPDIIPHIMRSSLMLSNSAVGHWGTSKFSPHEYHLSLIYHWHHEFQHDDKIVFNHDYLPIPLQDTSVLHFNYLPLCCIGQPPPCYHVNIKYQALITWESCWNSSNSNKLQISTFALIACRVLFDIETLWFCIFFSLVNYDQIT